MLIISRAAVAMLITCATACSSPADVPHDHATEDASAPAAVARHSQPGEASAFTGILLCEHDGFYGTPLPYVAIDADGDGFTVPATGEVCTDGTLPPPYRAAAHGLDCDDADPLVAHVAVLYPDQDGDGVGAPPRQILCIGAQPPAGLVRRGYDEAAADPAVIETDEDDEEELLVLGL